MIRTTGSLLSSGFHPSEGRIGRPQAIVMAPRAARETPTSVKWTKSCPRGLKRSIRRWL